MRRKITLTGHDGGRLAGILHSAEPARGAVVLSHCFTCSKDYKLMVWLARSLHRHGWTVLRFDFRGLGDSQGDFAGTTLSDDVADLRAAARWLASEEIPPLGLIGHSMGGAAAILAAPGVESVRSVGVIGTTHDPARVTRILTPEHWRELETSGVAVVPVEGRPHPISREFVADLRRHSLADAMRDWGRRLAVLHGTLDTLVPVESAQQLFEAAPQPRVFFPLEGADHLVTNRDHAAAAADFLHLWLSV